MEHYPAPGAPSRNIIAGFSLTTSRRLLGAKDLGVAEMPALDKPVADGSLAYHYHSRGHTVLPDDWKVFFDFADRHYKAAAKKPPDRSSSK